MNRILVDGEWFEAVASGSLYESEFEAIILSEASFLFPGYHVVPFKVLVTSDYDSAVADLALIEQGYREWRVVEVETGDHSLERHVAPQVNTLSQAAYSERQADYLCRKRPTLDKRAVLDMMKGKQPDVLVIVNEHRPGWEEVLTVHRAQVVVVEVFRSASGRYVLRTGRNQLRELGDVISTCHLHPTFPRLLALDAPGGLGLSRHELISMWYLDSITDWERVETRDSIWLNPVGRNPLSPRVTYELVRRGDGALEIRRALQQKG